MKSYDLPKLILKINKLKSCCGYDVYTNARVGDVNIETALKCLNKVLRHTKEEIYLTHVDHVNAKYLIYCCLILIKHSVLNCKLDFSKKLSKQAIIKIQTSFCLLLLMFPNERTQEIISIVMKFMDNENLWNNEAVSIEIFQCLLSSCECAEIIFHKILDHVDLLIAERNIDETICCVRILYSIININFKQLPSNALIRLIAYYHASVDVNDIKSGIYPLRIGFKVALMRLFRVINVKVLSEILPEILELTYAMECNFSLKEFGFTMQQGILELSTNVISSNLKPKVIEQLLLMMNSRCETECNIACNFFTILIDHYRNSKYFQVPMIFFLYTNYYFKKGNENDQAMTIINKYANKIEDSMVKAVQAHGNIYENLLSVYKLMCVFVVSLPSGKIIIMIMKILLKLQNFAIDMLKVFGHDGMNSIHAMVISIMTLICHVTRAKSLSKYIHDIVGFRYDIMPQLNPPIMKKKGENDKNIKNELLLDKWELRYCLLQFYKLGDVLNDEKPTNRMGSIW